MSAPMDDELRRDMNSMIDCLIEMFADRGFFEGTRMQKVAREMRAKRQMKLDYQTLTPWPELNALLTDIDKRLKRIESE